MTSFIIATVVMFQQFGMVQADTDANITVHSRPIIFIVLVLFAAVLFALGHMNNEKVTAKGVISKREVVPPQPVVTTVKRTSAEIELIKVIADGQRYGVFVTRTDGEFFLPFHLDDNPAKPFVIRRKRSKALQSLKAFLVDPACQPTIKQLIADKTIIQLPAKEMAS